MARDDHCAFPGGRLVGASFVRGSDTLRQRLLVRPGAGDFGPVGSEAEVETWLAEAGFEPASLRRAGPMLYFDARRRARLTSATPFSPTR